MLFTKDYSRLLLIPEGKEGAVSIPGSTTYVPAQAISLCQSGSSLTAGDGSAEFASHNGMLFSKDMKTLVACPPAIGNAVVLPAETEVIGEYALAGCKDLASITVLGNVRTIDPTAFASEVKASAVVALPAGEDYGARKATWEAAGFQHFAEPAQPGATVAFDANASNSEASSGFTFTLLADYTLSVSWEGKDNPAAELEIPASAEINGVPYRVSTVSPSAFANCGSLTSVKLPASITSIGDAAFAGCANLAAIELPNTLRTIGERAFEATGLADVWLPTSVESIGSRALASCESLARVVALGTPQVAGDSLAGCSNVSLYIPSGSENVWNPGLPSEGNHLMPYGVSLTEEPLAIEAGQQADLLEGGSLQAPAPIEATYSYAAAPLSVDAGRISAKQEGTTEVTALLTLDNVELARASRTVEVSPNPEVKTDVSLLNSETPLPASYLAELRDASAPISVSAPLQVVIGEGGGYDVATKPASATGTAVFKNSSTGTHVQLASVTCEDAGISDLLETNDPAKPLEKQNLFSLYPQGDDSKAVHFGYETGATPATPSDANKSAFAIAADFTAPYVFRLNLTNDPTLADAKVKEDVVTTSEDIKPLAKVTCTFESYTFTPEGHGKEGADFYLKNTSAPTQPVYSLEDVKAHAVDISQKGRGSFYYKMYADFAKDDSTYVCKSNWNDGETYELCVIGVLHDDLADGSGKAGVTFQFKNLLNTQHPMNSSTATNEGGWGSSKLRERMNPGGSDQEIWNLAPVDLQAKIVQVNKAYGSDWSSTSSAVECSRDYLFLASYCELLGAASANDNYAGKTWIAVEGYQYEYWQIKMASGNGGFVKHKQSASTPNGWWERTVSPNYNTNFIGVNSGGSPASGYGASNPWGVCPCFCL